MQPGTQTAKWLVGAVPQSLVLANFISFASPRKWEGSLIALLVLSPRNPLRWACAGTPFAENYAAAHRSGA